MTHLNKIGNITLDSRYWDCECERMFIYPKAQLTCDKCGSHQDEQPDSHANEVEIFIKDGRI